ncbi:MAG: IclR family transcriptional regulator [Actinomycetota bacterium]
MDSVSGVGVLDKAFTVLQALAHEPLALAGVVEATGLPRATAHRLLLALETHGAVRRNDAGEFCIGLAVVGLATAATDQFPWLDKARAAARGLRDATGESVQVYVPEGNGRRCIASFESTHGLRWIVPVGALLPLSRGSAGRVLSGQKVTHGGWIESSEEREKGVASVSAPVTDADGNVIAAVSLSGPLERMGQNPGRRHGAAVARGARDLSR